MKRKSFAGIPSYGQTLKFEFPSVEQANEFSLEMGGYGLVMCGRIIEVVVPADYIEPTREVARGFHGVER